MRWLVSLPGRCAIACVRFYQRGISPLLGANCRYQPRVASTRFKRFKNTDCSEDAGAVLLGESCVVIVCTRGGFDPP